MSIKADARRRALFPGEWLIAALVVMVLSMGRRPSVSYAQSPFTLYTANGNSNAVTEFAPGAGGNAAPATAISGPATGLLSPSAIAIDSGGRIYVSNFASGPIGTGSVTIFPLAGAGNVSPTAAIVGVGTQLAGPEGLALDGQGDIYVANFANLVTEYASGSSGDALPIASIAGAGTQLAAPTGIAIDASGKIYVTNLIGGVSAAGSVTVYPPGSNGDAAPLATIAGSNTGLSGPEGIAIDAAGSIYVANLVGGSSGTGSITIYASGSSGDAAPTATISGAQLQGPQSVAVDSSGNIYIATSANSIVEYAAGSNGDAAPTLVINGGSTGLNAPRGIALRQQSASATPTITPTPTATPTTTPTPTPVPSPTPSPAFLKITPPSANFPNVGTDTSATVKIKLENIGKAKLVGTVSNNGLAGTPFSIKAGAGAFSLGHNKTRMVTIKFAPAAPVESSASITITSNDPGNPDVQVGVNGTGAPGALGVSATALDFASEKVHKARTLGLIIKNTGLGVLHVEVDLSGLTAPFSATVPSTLSLAAKKSRTVKVKFAPTAPGQFQGTIAITSDGSTPSGASVSVMGTGH